MITEQILKPLPPSLCSGLREDLNKQGFQIVGYGCTTCIGNSGDLDKSVAAAIEGTGNKHHDVYINILICFYFPKYK